MHNKFQIRALQIDLNRQYETMDFIRSYIDFAADNGYNTLLLYIGWRIKMKSLPWDVTGGTYTPEDIREIVAYAKSRNMDVLPTTNLTYVNSLTRVEELKELLEDGTRFWGTVRGNFCLANPKIYDFITNYLTELAELVPSPYIHIGGDEAWDTGYCEKCHGDDFSFAKEYTLYKDFILKCYDIVTKKLNRRVIMWDDMFNYYPAVLPELPRDIIMAHWQYQEDMHISVCQFGNRIRSHRLHQYDELGFEYLIAPATQSCANGRTYTEHTCDGKNLLGGLMTTWVTHWRFMYKAMPQIASVGRYWAGEKSEQDAFDKFALKYLGKQSEAFYAAIRSFAENNMTRFTSFSAVGLTTFGFDGLHYGRQADRQMVLAILNSPASDIPTETGRRIVDEIKITTALECAYFEVKNHFKNLIYSPGAFDRSQLDKAMQNLKNCAAAYIARWDDYRPGITPNCIADYLNKFIASTEDMISKLLPRRFVQILFASPNPYGAVYMTVKVKHADGELTLLQGGGARGESAYFERTFALPEGIEPEAVTVKVKGYCGQSIAYISAQTENGIYTPYAVETTGTVTNSNHLLTNNCTVAHLGEPDGDKAWQNRAIADAESSVTVKLKK